MAGKSWTTPGREANTNIQYTEALMPLYPTPIIFCCSRERASDGERWRHVIRLQRKSLQVTHGFAGPRVAR